MLVILFLIAFLSLHTPAMADESACLDLSCLLCDQLSNDEHYAEGSMKAMKYIAPGQHSWLFRSEYDLSHDFGIPKSFRESFKRLIQEFNQKGTEVVVVVQPTRGIMHRDKLPDPVQYPFDFAKARKNLNSFLEQLRAGGAVVPNVLTLVDSSFDQEYFFRRDHHWTPFGARQTALLAAQTIKTLSHYSDIEKKAYITEKGTVIPKDGTMNWALKHICGNNYGLQFVEGFQTVPAENDENALFGDAADPEIALVGTSNSAERDDEYKNYNFSGFLKQELEADILNYSLAGAGQDGSLLQYLLSEDYDPSNAPKFIIWELPANYRLDDELMYRQLIPAVNGGCKTAQTKYFGERYNVASMKENERIELVANTGTKQEHLKNFKGFLEIEFSSKSIKDFYIITYYDNGQRDKVWFRRPAMVDGGKYFLEMSQDDRFKDANLLSVFLEPSKAIDQSFSVTAAICL